MRPSTLGELEAGSFGEAPNRNRTVKDELRANLIRKLQSGDRLFPGIIGFEDTVIPQVVNAILSRHNMILLGLRGQAKSRILRELTCFLDAWIPVVAECEINDNPFSPICRRCKDRIQEIGEQTPIAFRSREERYVEKLATPDVTMADIIGDIDPIKAAKRGHSLASELAIHYRLLPRANRGIFAINELPDLAGKIQVGLFNIMQEGDVQIKGYPLRLPLDVVLAFSANPEDYTASGKIVTPLKDRIGSEVTTHYPDRVEQAVAIALQEAWTDRRFRSLVVPRFIREVVEAIAFRARADQRVDRQSGVSQRLTISCMENVVSNAERRAIVANECGVVARVADVYCAIPAITGKLELEYEGELKGAETVPRDLIRQAVQTTFWRYFPATEFRSVVEWFESGGTLKTSPLEPAAAVVLKVEAVPGLMDETDHLGASAESPVAVRAAAEFILDGLHAAGKVSWSEEKDFFAPEPKSAREAYREYPLERDGYKKPLN